MVFDFGSEIYVWYGKNVHVTKRKPAIRLARQLFDDGYDYSQYDVNPIEVAMCLGDRSEYPATLFYCVCLCFWSGFAGLYFHKRRVF